MAAGQKTRRETPAEWAINPSSPVQRAPVVVLSIIGLATSAWFGLRVVGKFQGIWEPLGSVLFGIVLMTALTGGRVRWRERPGLTITAFVAIGLTVAVS